MKITIGNVPKLYSSLYMCKKILGDISVLRYQELTIFQNQLLQLCTASTAWSNSVIMSDSVIKLVAVLFGKCTTLVAANADQ